MYMESNPDPTYIAIRIEPEGLRERRNALKLKACIAALKTWNTRYIDRREA